MPLALMTCSSGGWQRMAAAWRNGQSMAASRGAALAIRAWRGVIIIVASNGNDGSLGLAAAHNEITWRSGVAS